MKLTRFLLAVLCLITLTATSAAHAQSTVSLQTLLEEMIDRDGLAQFPTPAYLCHQASSYDRGSVTPGDVSWFANSDRSMFVRTEESDGRTEYVMMDAEGPGAIVRFWMTFSGPDCGKGTLRIYLDGAKKPTIVGTALDIISGGALVGAPLSTSVSDLTLYENRGHNLYLPIPYSKGCKVTYESSNIKDFGAKTGGECVYYNINYRAYAPDTKVNTFSNKELAKNDQLIAKVQRLLQHRSLELPEGSTSQRIDNKRLASGESFSYTITEPNAAIRKVRFNVKAADKEEALRNTFVSFSFDSHKTIECPIGYFFSSGYRINSQHTWYGRVDIEGSLTSYWVMPFVRECVVSIENRGSQEVQITEGELTYGPFAWGDNTMYFHADWKEQKNMEIGWREAGAFDFNYITLEGKGVYVGDALTVYNRVDAWWGEGDEKVYVDGEEFPSHFGTGTEDYYGYAWCRPERISNHPYIAQPSGDGNFHPGYTVNIRYRGLDAIPFNTSLRCDMEVWHWVKSELDFSPVTFWYQIHK